MPITNTTHAVQTPDGLLEWKETAARRDGKWVKACYDARLDGRYIPGRELRERFLLFAIFGDMDGRVVAPDANERPAC